METRNPVMIFSSLISIVFLSGACQGMLLPLLSILLEAGGTHASLNGLNASALYLGILAAAPFMESALYRFGFKPLLLVGTLAVAVMLPLFPLVNHYLAWFLLRFFIGIFNHIFHYATVVWLGYFAPENKRGRYLSYYGFAFGIGFSMGPILSELRGISIYLPFYLTGALSLASMVLVWFLNFGKQIVPEKESVHGTLGSRIQKVLGLAWFALLPPVGYGMLEAVISGSLPIFLTRMALESRWISTILSVFFMAGLVTQLPIGRLSDWLGRKKILIILLSLGIVGFSAAALADPAKGVSLVCYAVCGGALGSIYSLGVTYMTDCTPKSLLPTGNMLCSMAFGVGSLAGPFLGGLYIEHLPGVNFAWLLVGVFCLVWTGVVLGRPRSLQGGRG